jgi:hypothetical protein
METFMDKVQGFTAATLKLLVALTRGGHYRGNAWASNEVKAVLKEVAADRGIKDVYQALDGLPEYDNYSSRLRKKWTPRLRFSPVSVIL